mmetsp:Transcript_22520/g.41297  ORF Transcript_22520/g.41297 Transcript_22520/m.41297 type:complete len:276 (-) Transcript_22520:85-912(-)
MRKLAFVLPSLAYFCHGWHQHTSELRSSSPHAQAQGTLDTLAGLLLTFGPAATFNPSSAKPIGSMHHQRLFAGPAVHIVAKAAEGVACQDEEAIRADAETAFRLLDLNADGSISDDEFKKYLKRYRYTDDAVSKIFEELDLNGNGEVCLDELRNGLLEYCRCGQCAPKSENRAVAEADEMFDLVDVNKDGAISGSELHEHLLKQGYTETAVKEVFRSLDSNDDGELSREELREGFLKYAMLREAMVAVVKTIVKDKRWSLGQREREAQKKAALAQ